MYFEVYSPTFLSHRLFLHIADTQHSYIAHVVTKTNFLGQHSKTTKILKMTMDFTTLNILEITFERIVSFGLIFDSV